MIRVAERGPAADRGAAAVEIDWGDRLDVLDIALRSSRAGSRRWGCTDRGPRRSQRERDALAAARVADPDRSRFWLMCPLSTPPPSVACRRDDGVGVVEREVGRPSGRRPGCCWSRRRSRSCRTRPGAGPGSRTRCSCARCRGQMTTSGICPREAMLVG